MVKHRYSPLVIQGWCQIQDRKFPALTHRFPALTHRFPALVFFKNLYNQRSGPMNEYLRMCHSCALNVHFVSILHFQGPWMCYIPISGAMNVSTWGLLYLQTLTFAGLMNINHASISSHSGLMNEYVIQSGHLSPNLIFTFRAHELRRAISIGSFGLQCIQGPWTKLSWIHWSSHSGHVNDKTSHMVAFSYRFKSVQGLWTKLSWTHKFTLGGSGHMNDNSFQVQL